MVVARETTLQDLLEGTKQYQVPLYQRTYSWTRSQLMRLWEDLLKLAEDRIDDKAATHFIGSLVLAPSPANGPTGVQEFLVVDGQQRLTTLTILLTAIRDHRRENETPEHFERINEQYLINKWRVGNQRLKLLPTQADRDSYQACIDATPSAGGTDAVGAAYRFFKAALVEADDPEDEFDIERIEDATISGLAVVSVTAQPADNAHRIFESLNNTGLRLTQGDLLRNYLFMRLPSQADAVYQGLWLPLQNELSAADLELLFWLDLVQADPKIKQTEIYSRQQARLDRLKTEEEIRSEIERFARLGKLLRLILFPTDELDSGVRLRLHRLRSWGTTTVFPITLHLLDRRDRGTATSATVAQSLLYLESFLVRRLLIGRATANINRILLSAVSEIANQEDVALALHRYLSSGRKYYASDTEVASALKTVPFYLNGRPKQRKLVLEWLEESYTSKEPVNPQSLTIEHILPRTPTNAWRAELAPDLEAGERFEDVHSALEHTLGNLTLTGYNSALSNSSFETKRDLLSSSGLRMNQEIAAVDRWGRIAILGRATSLAERVATIWPAPIEVPDEPEMTPQWSLLAKALAELPHGAWTSYGDLAALIGSHAVPVGMRIANHPVENGHRVLQAGGTVSPGFRWYEPDRTDDPIQVLKSEGIEFDEHGHANPVQRFSVDDLANLLGEEFEEFPPELLIPSGQDQALRESFITQLTEGTTSAETHAVLSVVSMWNALGGAIEYGTASQTSCFLMLRIGEQGSIWPFTIYPTGHLEVVFQYLSTRAPFDDIRLRDQFRRKLNQVPGIDIPSAKLALRPNIRASAITDESAMNLIGQALEWFISQIHQVQTNAVEDDLQY